MSNLSYIDRPCERCGSKKRISRTWKETIPTFTGTTVVEYSQIICTNPICQKAFDENLAKETAKNLKMRKEKEEREKLRKSKFTHAQKSHV
jgi:hypothetical protein